MAPAVMAHPEARTTKEVKPLWSRGVYRTGPSGTSVEGPSFAKRKTATVTNCLMMRRGCFFGSAFSGFGISSDLRSMTVSDLFGILLLRAGMLACGLLLATTS